MMKTVDRELTAPKKTTISNLIDKYYEGEVHKFRRRLDAARRLAIGIYFWTKKGLTDSFVAISSC